MSSRQHARGKIKVGDVIVLRYYDAVFFRDVPDSSKVKPIIREAIGWVDYEDEEYVRLVWERCAEAVLNEESRIRVTGLAILKSVIIEVKKLV